MNGGYEASCSLDGVRVRVLADAKPLPDAVPVVPDLEDAYLKVMHSTAPEEANIIATRSSEMCQ
jgi:hypothetical protein